MVETPNQIGHLLAGVDRIRIEGHKAVELGVVCPAEAEGKPVVPALLHDPGPLRQVGIDPARGLDTGDRRSVHVQEGESPRGRQDDDGRGGEPEHPKPRSTPQRPRSDEHDCRQQDECGVGGLEVAGEGYETSAVGGENGDREHERQDRPRIADTEEAVSRVGDARNGRKTKRKPQSPEEDVLQRKDVARAVRPLDERRITGVAAGQDALLAQDVEEPSVQSDVPDVWAGEGVWLGNPEHSESGRTAPGEPEEALSQQGSDPPRSPAASGRRDHPYNDRRDRQCDQRQRSHLACEPEADRSTAEEVAGRATRAGDPDREVERCGGEEGQVWVNGPEVGELDLEHGERREQRSEQSHAPRPEQRANREHEQDGARVEQRRERAPDEVGVVESRVACRLRHCLAEEERERAVRVARPLVGVQRRVLGIEIGPK